MKINIGEYYGLKLSKKSLHQKIINDESVTGVYTKKGNKILFKRVDVIYSDENIAICKYYDTSGNQDITLQLGEEVILYGNDLYDGKYIN